MSAGEAFLRLYLPLLTQEGGIMVSTFTLGIKAGVGKTVLAGIDAAAVITDLGVFFLPCYFLARSPHARLLVRLRDRYETAVRPVARFGTFWTAAIAAFAMPSVSAMIIIGLLRLPFWRAFGGLLAGSAAYAALPLLVASPIASVLPGYLVPALQWTVPALVVLYLLVAVARWRISEHRAASREP
jgi:hypothetical protein